MRTLLLTLAAAATAALALSAEAPSGRVLVLSLDGMSWQTLQNDPATQPLTALRALLKAGAHADGMTPHFPSTTSNSHAAMWTGAWGDVSGITSNNTPLAPRSEHTAFERRSGFYSDSLRAEPLWLAAARQGVRTVTAEATQTYPFTPNITGTNPDAPLTMLNGYQTHESKAIVPDLFLHRKDVKTEPCPQRLCFSWQAGPVTFHAALLKEGIRISAGTEFVEVRAAPGETESPARRDLARRFSPGLYLPEFPAVVYFRLFELSPDGSDFFLYQSPIREMALFDHGQTSLQLLDQLLHEAGGFFGNGPDARLTSEPLELGLPMWKGGDGTAERRYLEITELLTRQSIRQTEWMWKHFAPRLLLGYLPHPDEFEHTWKGLAAKDPRYNEYRTTGYAIVNRMVESFARLRGVNDDFLVVSDHGMAAIDHQIAINAALKDAGLADQVSYLENCLLINTTDWKGGVVAPGNRSAVIAKAEAALRAIPAITTIFDSRDDAFRFGFGGPNGADLCFDYQPGYVTTNAKDGPVIREAVPPRGNHGMNPDRPEMKAILIGVGPGLPSGTTWLGVRSIDVASLIARLLGIRPPANAVGVSPLN